MARRLSGPQPAGDNSHLRCVGKISVMRQSRAALPQLMTELNTALTIRLFRLLYTKNMPTAQSPDVKVLNTAHGRTC